MMISRAAPDRAVVLGGNRTRRGADTPQVLASVSRTIRATGAWRGRSRIGAVDVPDGVRLVIGRRLDRLAAHRQMNVLSPDPAAALVLCPRTILVDGACPNGREQNRTIKVN